MPVFSNSAAIPPACKSLDTEPHRHHRRRHGIRNLGRDLRAIGHKQEQIRIAFTHFHWDHIQGFPFFAPAYDPGQKITLLTLGRDQTITNLREIFEVQMQSEYFPVPIGSHGSEFRIPANR